MAELQIATVNHHHRYIVDWELDNPGGKMGELAKILGYTETHLSIVRNSDAFKDYRDRRRAKHDENISKSIIDRVGELAETSMEVLAERIKDERKSLGLGIVKDTAEMALKALGFGAARSGPSIGTLNFVNGVPPEDLERARLKMRERNEPSVIEGEHNGEGRTLPAPT